MSNEWKKKEIVTKIREDKYYDRANTVNIKLTLKVMAKVAKKIAYTDI